MDCETASGLMPWLMNGTLAAAEAEALRSHLASCAACRKEMDETRRAAEVFAAHPSADAILDLASGRPTADADLVRRHVDGCAECTEDLALAREGLPAEQPTVRPIRPGIGRWVALPATLAAGLVIGLAWPRGGLPVAPAPADPRVGQLQGEVARLQEEMGGLRSEVERAGAPELNVPVVELLEAPLTRGGSSGALQDVLLPAEAKRVALLLTSSGPGDAPAALVIRRPGGDVVWQADGLRATAIGAYTLSVPAALLSDGEYVLALKPRGARVVEYRVRVRRKAS